MSFFLYDIQTACLTIGDDGALGNRELACSFNPLYRKRRKFFLIHKQPHLNEQVDIQSYFKTPRVYRNILVGRGAS